MWIDSHCHLNHANTAETDTPADIIARARAAGVEGQLNISCQIHGDFPIVLMTAQENEGVWASVGTHPHDAGDASEQAVTLDQLIDLAGSDDKIVGIGESGLDYFYDNAPRDAQAQSFRKHIRAAIATGLPLIVHARDADEDIIGIIREEGGAKAGLRGVMHCFSSGRGLMEAALEEGFYISFSGIVTFKRSDQLRDMARDVPLERLLVETDAPFLAPQPKRGQVNESAYVPMTGAVLAEIKGVSVEEIAAVTRANFFTLFDKARFDKARAAP